MSYVMVTIDDNLASHR